MQWLIDLIKEWIIAQGYLTHGFVDRGDPAARDFVTGDFTTDGNWHDLDLSGIIPAGAKGICFICYIKDDLAAVFIDFRKKGNVNEENKSTIRSEAAGLWRYEDLTCAVSTDRKIEYKSTVTTFDFIRMTVKNWWF